MAAYNEATRLPRSVRKRAKYFSRVPWTHEVRIAVEKSADRSLELARRLAAEQVNFHAIVNAVHRGERYTSCDEMQAACEIFARHTIDGFAFDVVTLILAGALLSLG